MVQDFTDLSVCFEQTDLTRQIYEGSLPQVINIFTVCSRNMEDEIYKHVYRRTVEILQRTRIL